MGVGGVKSQAGYYYMADFEVVREGLRRRGFHTSEEMTRAMLEEADVAVRVCACVRVRVRVCVCVCVFI